LVTFTIVCGNAYTINAASSPTSPQYVSHEDSSVGYTLPVYVTSQQTGCPTNLIELTSDASSIVTHTSLDEVVL